MEITYRRFHSVHCTSGAFPSFQLTCRTRLNYYSLQKEMACCRRNALSLTDPSWPRSLAHSFLGPRCVFSGLKNQIDRSYSNHDASEMAQGTGFNQEFECLKLRQNLMAPFASKSNSQLGLFY